MYAPQQRRNQPVDRSRSHAATCHKDIPLLFFESQTFFRRLLHLFAHNAVRVCIRRSTFFRHTSPRLTACRSHRNACHHQLFFRNPAFHNLRDQTLVRNHIIVAVRLFPERDTGIIRHHRHRERKLHSLSLHIGNGFRRIQMRHDNHVRRMFLQIRRQVDCHLPIDIIDRRTTEKPADKHADLIQKSEQTRGNLYRLHIDVTDRPRDLLSCKLKIIQHHRLVPMRTESLRNRACRRVVSTACIT